MKRIALLFSCALLTAPVFAASDLCSVNLQKLDDQMASTSMLSEPVKKQVEDLRDAARKAQQAGNTQECSGNASQALTLLEKSDKGGAN